MGSMLKSFEFDGKGLRAVYREDGSIWIIAKDLCEILEIKNPSRVIKDVCKSVESLNYTETSSFGLSNRGPSILVKEDVNLLIESTNYDKVKELWDFMNDSVYKEETETYNNSNQTEGETVMDNKLVITSSHNFNGVIFDCYQSEDNKEEYWGTREQVGRMLEYSDPDAAIRNLHSRNKDRLDKFSTCIELIQVEGNRSVTRNIIVYSFKGLLEICRFSRQPKADVVMDFLWEIANTIRKTGEYKDPKFYKKQTDKNVFESDTEFKRLELKLENKRLDVEVLKVKAGIVKDMLNASPVVDDRIYNFFGVSSTQYSKSTTEQSSPINVGEDPFSSTSDVIDVPSEFPTAPTFPTERYYTATEIGNMFGRSAKEIGRLAKESGIQPPKDMESMYGVWENKINKDTGCPYSWFLYNKRAVEEIKKLIMC